jgi:type II restriction enzyme
MKYLSFYKEKLNCKNEDEVFAYLLSTLKPSNTLWSYFVNWEKVIANTKDIEIELNILNYLIGKSSFDEEFKRLITKHPEVTKAIPALIAVSKKKRTALKILVDYKNKKLTYEDYDFSKKKLSTDDISKYLTFVKGTGLKQLFTSKRIKNLVDYMIGIEAGLDSNGRKNRGGDAMEEIVEAFINDLCRINMYKYIKEANAGKIKDKLSYIVPVDKSSRRYDFVIDNGKELFLIETNFYGGSGSKLKSTAGEYHSLYNALKGKFKFIWITDGLGWTKTSRPLRETFNHNEYVLNLSMLEKGALEALLK